MEGLIHVSELSDQRVNHPKEIVREGEVVTLRIIKIDGERHRIGLSKRKVDSPAYTDLDWKMALSEEVDRTQDESPILPVDVDIENNLDSVAPVDESPEVLADGEPPNL